MLKCIKGDIEFFMTTSTKPGFFTQWKSKFEWKNIMQLTCMGIRHTDVWPIHN